jgi:hypothetical protein
MPAERGKERATVLHLPHGLISLPAFFHHDCTVSAKSAPRHFSPVVFVVSKSSMCFNEQEPESLFKSEGQGSPVTVKRHDAHLRQVLRIGKLAMEYCAAHISVFVICASYEAHPAFPSSKGPKAKLRSSMLLGKLDLIQGVKALTTIDSTAVPSELCHENG